MIQLAVGSIAIYFLEPDLAIFIIFAAWLSYLFPSRRWVWIGIATVASWIFSQRFIPKRFWPELSTIDYYSTLALYALIAWVAWECIYRLGKKFSSYRIPISITSLTIAPLAFHFFPHFGLAVVGVIYAKFFLFLFLPKSLPFPYSFWTDTVNPLQTEFHKNQIAQSRSDWKKSIHSGMLLLTLALAIKTIYSFFMFILSSPPIHTFAYGQFFDVQPPYYTLADIWENPSWSANRVRLQVLYNLISFLHTYYGASAAIVGGIRLCGFKIFRNIYRPNDAKSFSEFYFRFFYFYSLFILRFFYYPIFYRLKFWNNPKTRAVISMFLAIFLGGHVLHFLKAFGLIFQNGFFYALNKQYSFSFYFFFIATLCAASNYAQLKNWPSKLPRPLLIILCFAAIFCGHLIYTARLLDLPAGAEWSILNRALQ